MTQNSVNAYQVVQAYLYTNIVIDSMNYVYAFCTKD